MTSNISIINKATGVTLRFPLGDGTGYISAEVQGNVSAAEEYEAHYQAMEDDFVAGLEPCESMDEEELLEEQASAQIEKGVRAEEYYAWVDSQIVDLTEDEVKALAETPTLGGV